MRKHKTRKCSCYDGFDCPACNPSYYEKQRKHSTPWNNPVTGNKTNATANDWADAIAKSISSKIDPIPEGFETARQVSDRIGKRSTQTKLYLKELILEGKAEMKKFYIKSENTRSYIPHYRLLK